MDPPNPTTQHRPSTRTISSSYTPTPLTSRPYTYSSPGSALNQSEDPVVIEIGTRYLRAGFANEAAPRCEIPYTEDMWRRVGDRVPDTGKRGGSMLAQKPGATIVEEKIKKKSTRRSRGELWQFDLRALDTGLVEDLVERAAREAYNKYLLVDSKTKKIVIPIPPLFPSYLMKAVANTIFTHFQPPTISFFSAPVLCTIAAGLRSALVVDIGWHETVVTPIYELRVIGGLVGASGRTKRAGKLLRKNMQRALENLLAEKGIEGTKLREDFVEELVSRVAWCENYQIRKREREEQRRLQKSNPETSSPLAQPNYSSAGTSTMLIPLLTDSHKPLSINIPLSTLSQPLESTFFSTTSSNKQSEEEEPDEDDLPLPHLLYRSLLSCPIDIRATSLARIVIIGGPSNVPGLKKRIIDELRGLVEEKGGWNSMKKLHKKSQVRRDGTTPVDNDLLPPPPPPKGNDNDTIDDKPLPAIPPRSPDSPIPADIDEAVEHFTIRDRLKKYLQLEEKESLKPKYPPGMIRGVKSLGAWAGGSIVAGARVKGLVEIEREKFLAAVAAGGMGIPQNLLQ